MNQFLKYEREIGLDNSVTITDDVYRGLTSPALKSAFHPAEPNKSLRRRQVSKGLFRSFGRRPRLLVDHGDAEQALISAVQIAEKFIAVIGGKGGTARYMEALTEKLRHSSVSYHRLVTGSPIPHFLCTHLTALVRRPRTYSAFDANEKYGVVLATEREVILTSAGPRGAGSFVVLRVPDAAIGEQYREFILQLLSEQKRIGDESQIRELCKTCGAGPA